MSGQARWLRRSAAGVWLIASCVLPVAGCGYSARPGLASNLKTVYVKPFVNKINITEVSTNNDRFQIFRHGLEVDLTKAVLSRFQVTGLLRPSAPDRADARLEGELVDLRKDALRFDASQQVEEWRINLVVNIRFIDRATNTVIWEEDGFTGDITYFALGANTESETSAVSRAVTDLARRIVERTVENW